MKKIYLCRHGEIEWTLTGQHTGRTDLPLTEQGKKQAALLREKLRGIQFEKVFSSPLKRAVETSLGMDPILDRDLVECNYGDYEGLNSSQIQKSNPGWNLFAHGAPGGESLAEMRIRADHFLNKLSELDGPIAVFSHGHFLRVLAARFLGLEPQIGRILSLSVASISILSFEKREPIIALWNDTNHLF